MDLNQRKTYFAGMRLNQTRAILPYELHAGIEPTIICLQNRSIASNAYGAYAAHTGFEPVIFCVTGRRGRPNSPNEPIEQVDGIEPTLFQCGRLAHHHLCVTRF